MDVEVGETVQLADLVSSAAASVREARVAADTWQQIQRFPAWYLNILDVPRRLPSSISSWLRLHKSKSGRGLKEEAARRLAAAREVEEAHLRHLGTLVQWHQQYAPDVNLLGTPKGSADSRHTRENLDRLLHMLDIPASTPQGDDGQTSTASAPENTVGYGGSNVQRALLAVMRKPEPTLDRYRPPSWVRRNWPALLAVGCGAYLGLALWRGLDVTAAIKHYGHETYVALKRFTMERIWEPMIQMYNTVRYDEKQFAVQSAKSLESDLNSLNRMVLDFGREALQLNGEELQRLEEQVEEGDLTAVMKHFETEMKHPVRGAILGDMVRTTLIQVQKGKVDMQTALSAMDKLLKSNELVFQVMALVPALLIAAIILAIPGRYLRARFSRRFRADGRSMRIYLLQVARAVHACSKAPPKGVDRLVIEGRLLFTCVELAEAVNGARTLAYSSKEEILSDLKDLLTTGDMSALTPEAAAQRRQRVLAIVEQTLRVSQQRSRLFF